jgi:AraC-like DNA-binding protein
MSDQLKNEIFYPAIHEKDEEWGMTVTTSGFQLISPYASYPPKGHPQSHSYNYLNGRILDEFQLIYITRGRGIFSATNIEKNILEEGTVFMLFPGEWHTYRPMEDSGWEAYWAGFRGNQASQLVKNNFFQVENPFFYIGYNEELVKLFQQIIEHARREEPGSQQLLGGIVYHMLGYLFHFRRNEIFSNKAIVSTINKARVLMREHVRTNISPEEIAGILNISYSWFRRIFRQYTGFSPAQYIIQLKVQLAKELLAQTNDSVKQIASGLGFEPTDYFSIFFKRSTGLTPLEYRAMCRKK